LVDGTAATYRYTFTGNFQPGPVTVNLLDGSFADLAGNTNIAGEAGAFTALSCIWIEDLSVVERNGGSVRAGFRVALSAPSSTPVAVRYATVGGTALAGKDFSTTAGTLKFKPGETTKTIVVKVKPDTLYEDDETFRVQLSRATGLPIGRGTATATIINDDTSPTVSIGDARIKEGKTGTRMMNFTVSLSKASGRTLTVAYATADGTATTADGDYQPVSGTLTFKPGKRTQTIGVPILGDLRYEAAETFQVNLTAPAGGTLGRAAGTGRIANDDAKSRLSTADMTTAEPAQNFAAVLSAVMLRAPGTLPATVNDGTPDGTAIAGGDHEAESARSRFEPRETTATISVDSSAGGLVEKNKALSLTLKGLVKATPAGGKAAGMARHSAPAAQSDDSSTRRDAYEAIHSARAVDEALLRLGDF
jgi:hypothetical protein